MKFVGLDRVKKERRRRQGEGEKSEDKIVSFFVKIFLFGRKKVVNLAFLLQPEVKVLGRQGHGTSNVCT